MYNPELAATTSQAVMLSILIVATAFFAYFVVSKRADIFGAILLMLLTAFMARNYYYVVYSAGAMLVLATVAYLTSYDEGTVSGALFWAGIGLFASLMIFYVMPETVKMGQDQAFIYIVLVPSFLIVLISDWKGKFNFEWENALAILIPIAFALAFVSMVGTSHIIWGAAIMLFGIILEYFNAGFASTVAFVSGFIIWLDDVIGYSLYPNYGNTAALHILGPVGAGLALIYLYLLVWGD
ncbi:hypothetical protein [Thermococcus sp.]|uniref:hypothetical protein n=1 Tax=Thermococcus sp. TaxID=35749 RepID=UPI0025DF115C|nr:hypothetical protein [Thermococcus sp.]